MKSFFKNYSESGFTIIELLIVIFIIGLMTTVVWANYSDFNRQFSLERSANHMAQRMRMISEKAMSSKVLESASGDFKGGYGISFNENESSYIVFADNNNNGKFELSDVVLETVFFEKGVIIQSVNFFGGGGCVQNIRSVVFLPPDPSVFIGGKTGDKSKCDKVEIILSREDLNMTKKITINRVGLIELE